MPLRTYIDCDRCGKAVQAGLAVRIDRIILGLHGEPLNTNQLGDTPQYAVCNPCGDGLRAFLKDDTPCP